MTLKVGADFDSNNWVELFKNDGDANNLLGANAANMYDDLYRTVTAGAITVAAVTALVPSESQYYGNQGLSLAALDTNDRIAIGYNGSLYNVTGQASGTYGGSVYVKSLSGSPTVRLRLISSGGTSVNGSTVVTSSSWQQVTVSGSLPHAAQSIRIEVECTAGTAAALVVVAPMIVSGSTLPQYLNCGANSLNENLSAYVMSARWRTGFVRPYQHLAGIGRCSIVLNNWDKRFSPEAGGSIWTSRTSTTSEIMLRVNEDDTILWTGYVTEWSPQGGTGGEKRCMLEAEDGRRYLDEAEIFPALATSDTPITLLQDVIDLVEANGVAKLTFGGGWSFGTDPQGLDFTGSIEAETVPYYFEQSPNESVRRGQIATSLLEDILLGIQAKMWFARHGSLVVDGPAEDGGAVAATFNDTAISVDYQWGQNIYNSVTVKAYPRTASGSTTKRLWRLRETMTIDAGATEYVRAYFTKENTDERCGGNSIALSGMTFSGGSITGSITDTDAMSCEIEIVNAAAGSRNWTTGTVIGQELTIEDAISRTREDSTSIAANGRKKLDIDSRWVAKGKWAKRLAQYIVNRFKDARGEVVSITGNYGADSQFADCYIGRKVRVADTQLGHDENYIVIGEDHRWEPGADSYNHVVKLYLELADTTTVGTTSV